MCVESDAGGATRYRGHLNQGDTPAVVKIDAENSEYEILESLLPLLERTYCFFVEIHSPVTLRKITSLLAGRGYPTPVGG